MAADSMAAEMRSFLTDSQAATEALGEELGRSLFPGALLVLDGQLGSGKTAFVRGLARGLGVVERVSSPTYALLQTYPGRLELAHLDAWMEGRERAFLLDGGLEALQPGGVTVIEWGERVLDVLPPTRLRARFEHAGPSARRIRLEVEGRDAASARWRALLAGLAAAPGRAEFSELGAKDAPPAAH